MLEGKDIMEYILCSDEMKRNMNKELLELKEKFRLLQRELDVEYHGEEFVLKREKAKERQQQKIKEYQLKMQKERQQKKKEEKEEKRRKKLEEYFCENEKVVL